MCPPAACIQLGLQCSLVSLANVLVAWSSFLHAHMLHASCSIPSVCMQVLKGTESRMLDAAEDEGRTPLWFTRANVEPVHPDWEGEGRPASGHVRLAPFDTLAGNVFGYLTYTFCFRTRLDAAKVKEGLRRM